MAEFLRPERGAYLRMLQCNARIAAARPSRCIAKTSRPERGAFGRLVNAREECLMSALGGKRTSSAKSTKGAGAAWLSTALCRTVKRSSQLGCKIQRVIERSELFVD